VAPHDLRRACARLCHSAGGELSKFSFCLDIAQGRPRKGTLAPDSGSCTPSMTSWASSRTPLRAEELTTASSDCSASLAFYRATRPVLSFEC
jgi:hypothetical protein